MASDDGSDCIEFKALSVIDLRMFSQSELRSFSIASNSSLGDLNRFDDEIVSPKINRAVFNESAGSRKQTYSRLRLAPRNSKIKSSLNRVTSADDGVCDENPELVAALKELLSDELVKNELPDDLVSDRNAFSPGPAEEAPRKVIVLALDASRTS
uniref:Uncharacterized protein n=1 Tax=Kalanchoe fedtschenkoi TaxID=63787 RepID=A0A7N0UVX3_KALFE